MRWVEGGKEGGKEREMDALWMHGGMMLGYMDG